MAVYQRVYGKSARTLLDKMDGWMDGWIYIYILDICIYIYVYAMERELCMLRHGKKRRCNKLQLSCGEKLRYPIFSHVAIHDAVCSYIYIFTLHVIEHSPPVCLMRHHSLHNPLACPHPQHCQGSNLPRWRPSVDADPKLNPNFGNGAVIIKKNK